MFNALPKHTDHCPSLELFSQLYPIEYYTSRVDRSFAKGVLEDEGQAFKIIGEFHDWSDIYSTNFPPHFLFT